MIWYRLTSPRAPTARSLSPVSISLMQVRRRERVMEVIGGEMDE
jgi:hypothetical protein